MRYARAAIVALAFATSASWAQSQLYAYPQKGQSKEQQAKDTSECQTWAKQNSGVVAPVSAH